MAKPRLGVEEDSTKLPLSIPATAPQNSSVRLSRPFSIPARPPPPPPIIITMRSTSAPVSTDSQSTESSDFTGYAPFMSALTSSVPFLSSSPTPSTSSSSQLAALLSPASSPAIRLPQDVSGDEEWEDIPLSPLVAPVPESSSPSTDSDEGTPLIVYHAGAQSEETTVPELRSRWSASSLSSVGPFAFARRYFSKAPRSAAKIPSAGKKVVGATRGKARKKKGKGRGLMPADARVVGVGGGGAASPDCASYPAPSPAPHGADTTQWRSTFPQSSAHDSASSSSEKSEVGHSMCSRVY
ncbi:hypothetical protein FB451DRAFT_1413439 [Mycena latifolia]|nr:hypothetical protein FB451DRAFT_1413439 [Mycena latifolia]